MNQVMRSCTKLQAVRHKRNMWFYFWTIAKPDNLEAKATNSFFINNELG